MAVAAAVAVDLRCYWSRCFHVLEMIHCRSRVLIENFHLHWSRKSRKMWTRVLSLYDSQLERFREHDVSCSFPINCLIVVAIRLEREREKVN